MATQPQRAWRAACPQCGAPVAFASAASASAVCSFCRSTLLRDGDALRRIGISAELFDDHTPLQLGATGTRQGLGFTLVGRLQYGYAAGTWNEWHALFDNGRSAWLSEDNGAYVIAFDAPLPADAPADAAALAGLQAGSRVQADGRAWQVASVVSARWIAAQGELPRPPAPAAEFTVVDLRNSAGEVATLDGSAAPPGWSVGRAVALSELALQGLKDSGDKVLAARALACPNCGAVLAVQLASTQSISCQQCQAVVDVSQGVGADLRHYLQNNAGVAGVAGAMPQLALGRTGRLALTADTGAEPLPWQVVGCIERCDIPAADEEASFWREYLLYHREAGFAFLVDSNEGWSWARPITGVPVLTGGAERAEWQGVRYRRRWAYDAQVTWVQGEFYWRVQRDERAHVTDYEGSGAQASHRLAREQSRGPTGGPMDGRSNQEVTWSAGQTLPAATVADAFAIAPADRAALQRDVSPVAFGGRGFVANTKLWVVVLIVAVMALMLTQCGSDDCADVKRTFGAASTEYRQCQRSGPQAGIGGFYGGSYGGSYGGYSSGGGHK